MKLPIKFGTTITLIGILAYCSEPTEKPIFQHEIKDEQTPWSPGNFDVKPNKFTFAMITDLNGGEREGVFSQAVEQLNLFRPEFVVSVGDLIDGGTEDANQLKKEWDSFDERAAKLKSPLFYVGGNHDLTNVEMRKFWSDRFGPRYYHFLYRDVLFLILTLKIIQKIEWMKFMSQGLKPLRYWTG